jgi:hypothetical protein
MARSWMASLSVFLVAIVALEAVGITAQDDQSPFSVAIAVPTRFGKRSIELYRPEQHFHVVLTNISKHDVSVWREWCSWGYFNLSFEVTDSEGKTVVVKKKQRGWGKNYPDFATIDPNGNFVIDVTFDPEVWENPPLPEEGKSQTLSIRAIYESAECGEAKESKVWTGRAVSEKKEYTIWR